MNPGIHGYIRYAEAYRDAKAQMNTVPRVNSTWTFPVLEHKVSITSVDHEDGDIHSDYYLVSCITCAKVLHLHSPVPLVCIGYHLADTNTEQEKI